MHRLALVAIALGGCLSNPTVEVDAQSIDVPRGASHDVRVSIDGDPMDDLDGLLWSVDDPDLATVVPAHDGKHLQIGGNLEGETVVHVFKYGQDVAIPVRIGPPAILEMWTVPTAIAARIGEQVEVHAKGLDTLARIQDITFDSRWTVRDPSIAQLDPAGMMVQAMDEGQTSLHVTNGHNGAVLTVTIFK